MLDTIKTLSKFEELVQKGYWKYFDPARVFTKYMTLVKTVGKEPSEEFGTQEFQDKLIEFTNNTYQTDPDFDPKDFYTITNTAVRRVKRFNTEGNQFTMKFRNLDGVSDLGSTIREVFRDMVATVLEDVRDSDRVGFSLNHPGLNKGQIWLPFLPMDQLTGDRIMEQVALVLNSNQDFNLDHEVQIKFVIVRNVVGGMKTRYVGNVQERLKEMYNERKPKGTMVKIDNQDNMCLSRALVVGKARHQYVNGELETPQDYSRICQGEKNGRGKQRKLAEELSDVAGVDKEKLCGLEEVEQFQQVLDGYQVKVISLDAADCIVYKGPEAPRKIYLYHHHDHFEPIISISRFVNRGFYCDNCDIGFNDQLKHSCGTKCPDCFQPKECENEYASIKCNNCLISFRSQKCFDAHKGVIRDGAKRKKLANVCAQVKKCPDCKVKLNKAVASGKKHVCGQNFCRRCKAHKPYPHDCYIQPIKQKVSEDSEDDEETSGNESVGEESEWGNPVFVFYDFESTQSTAALASKYGDVYVHEVNCVAIRRVCAKCWGEEKPYCDHSTTPGKQVFTGREALKEFCEYVFSRENMGCYALAHNAKGYDGQFILDYCHKQGILPHAIMKGLEIISFDALGVHFRDTLNYLQMPLAAMPKAFGFAELKKGYFPFLFNTPENEDYMGTLPDIRYFCPESMKVEARAKLVEWHAAETERKGDNYNFMEEMVAYCESDTHIVTNCAMRYRDIMIKRASVDVFVESTTIASACNRSFRKLFLEEDTIAIVPPGGYRQKARHSIIAIKWLKWLSHKNNIEIRHARNGGEVSVKYNDKLYKVDGQNRNDYKDLYEFQGCYFHGCPKCIRKRSERVAFGRASAKDAYEATEKKVAEIRAAGFQVTEIWECELNAMLRQDPEMKRFFVECKVKEPLNSRDALAGGRTESNCMLYKCKKGEKIEYVDVVSLYPWVNKYGKYPIGHPRIITEVKMGDKEDLYDRTTEGLVYCKVLPNDALPLPLLPYHFEGKLYFTSCRTCMELGNIERCHCTEEERALTGTWVTDELYYAMTAGYVLLEVYEIWSYEKMAKYDGVDPATGLFIKYINAFLKPKQEADGWPSWATTKAQKEQYLEDYFQHEGIRLENVEANPALRASSKIALNSFWGKFCQNEDLAKVEHFNDPHAYMKLMFDPSVVVNSVTDLNGKMMMVNYKNRDAYLEALPFSNVVIGAYTTAQARLKLNSYLEYLHPHQVLYMDTDSIFYVKRPNLGEIPVGEYLGDMSRELVKDFGVDSYITEFVSAGPKNYGYKVYNSKTGQIEPKIKVKGFTLNSAVAEKVNYECMEKFVQAFLTQGYSPSETVIERRIRRRPLDVPVTAPVKKDYRVVFDKRIPMRFRRGALPEVEFKPSDYFTLPYGYRQYNVFCLCIAIDIFCMFIFSYHFISVFVLQLLYSVFFCQCMH